jgi:transposase
MDATTVAVDLAKSVFELAVADGHWKIVERARLSRSQFERRFVNRCVDLVVMEACGSAHHWARYLQRLGIAVQLLPPRYVRAYVKRNKTDAVDAAALLEAARCADIVPVRVKSIEQQALQSLHRVRSGWMATRASRINALRGFCRILADPGTDIPQLLRPTMHTLLEEIRLLEARITQIERQLSEAAKQSAACQTLLSVPGIGLLTATAMLAATGGSVSHFQDARHFASWFDLTPKEHSSGGTRHLGRISKRGDRYLRMLLTHGARSVLRAATVAQRCGRPLDPLRQWAIALQARSNHNKATCALANKLARICYATLRDQEPFEKSRLLKQATRQAFPMPAYRPATPCSAEHSPIMATRVTPTAQDADNYAGSPPAVDSDWHRADADSMSARDNAIPPQMPDIRLQAFTRSARSKSRCSPTCGRSPYTLLACTRGIRYGRSPIAQRKTLL